MNKEKVVEKENWKTNFKKESLASEVLELASSQYPCLPVL